MTSFTLVDYVDPSAGARPLKAYQYVHGFARFCNAKYNTDMGDIDNPFIHLTNVAIQKHNDDYNSKHGWVGGSMG